MIFDARGWNICLKNQLGEHENGAVMSFQLKKIAGKNNVDGHIINLPEGFDGEAEKNLYIGGCMSFIDVFLKDQAEKEDERK